MKAYTSQRDVAGLGTVSVLEIKLTATESQRFHTMPKAGQRKWLQGAGLAADTYYCTNDSEGNVYYFEEV